MTVSSRVIDDKYASERGTEGYDSNPPSVKDGADGKLLGAGVSLGCDCIVLIVTLIG